MFFPQLTLPLQYAFSEKRRGDGVSRGRCLTQSRQDAKKGRGCFQIPPVATQRRHRRACPGGSLIDSYLAGSKTTTSPLRPPPPAADAVGRKDPGGLLAVNHCSIGASPMVAFAGGRADFAGSVPRSGYPTKPGVAQRTPGKRDDHIDILRRGFTVCDTPSGLKDACPFFPPEITSAGRG